MKKLIALLCAMALLLTLAAVPAAAEGGKALKICIISSGGIDDGNFNQDCYEGIQAFLANHPESSVKDVKETDLAELIPTVEKLAGDFDVFVLPGYNFGGIGDIVLANPDKYFLVVDSKIKDSEGRIRNVEFKMATQIAQLTLLLAEYLEYSDEDLERLRADAIRHLKETNGSFRY